MREEVLKILNESERSLGAIEIMKLIQNEYTSMDLQKLLAVLDALTDEGILYRRNDGNYMPFERSKLLKGKVEITSTGSGFVLLEGNDLYIPKSNLRGAADGDFVIAEVTKNKGEKKEGRVLRVLKRSLGNNLAEVYFADGKPYLKLLDAEKNKYNLILDETETNFNLVDGLIVKIELLKDLGRNDVIVKVDKVLGHKNSPDIDTLKVCSEFDIETEFNEDVLEEAKNMPKSISDIDIEGRRDLRNKRSFTIDGADTKDIDDAIRIEKLSNGNILLGVDIADVSHYVKEGSALKKTALNRGNSTYLADRVIPMLPVELSNGICSLSPNEDRLALSCEMEIDSQGNVVKYDIFKSVIRSKKKMTYDAVNKVLAGENVEGYEEYKEDLLMMRELSNLIEERRKSNGALDFISEEVKLVVDDKGKVTEVKKYETGEGQEIIENFMIAANEIVGTHIYNMSLPFVYRIHEAPSPEKIKEFVTFTSLLGYTLSGKHNFENISPLEVQKILNQLKDTDDYEILNKKLKRCMQKAIYSDANIGHFGLALAIYCHFTSPIRRFSDLMVHYFLTEYLVNENFSKDFIKKWSNSLPLVCEHISKTERNSDDAEYEVNDMKIAEYMENHIGEVYDAKIDGCMGKGFFVETDNLISGLVSLDTLDKFYYFDEDLMAYRDKKKRICYRLGDRVKVRCLSASKDARKVDFTIYNGD